MVGLSRKELYLALHPETGQGKAPGAGQGKGKVGKSQNLASSNSFVDESAKATNKSKSAIKEAVQIASSLPDGSTAATGRVLEPRIKIQILDLDPSSTNRRTDNDASTCTRPIATDSDTLPNMTVSERCLYRR